MFKPWTLRTDALVQQMIELATIARKEGMMALEGRPVPDKFFERGLQMLVDGADEAKLTKQLKQEIRALKSRHEGVQGVIKAWVDIGPAMGMIGTLIGLVLMLGNMSDVKAIGPAMAVALLTTLYGAMIANVIFGPILTKMQARTAAEVEYRTLVIEGLRGIVRGESPRVIEDQMIAALEPPAQEKLRAAA
jgi:chemotaxis protein MotA